MKGQLQIELLMNEDWKERYLAIKRFEKKKIVHVKELNPRRKEKEEDEY